MTTACPVCRARVIVRRWGPATGPTGFTETDACGSSYWWGEGARALSPCAEAPASTGVAT